MSHNPIIILGQYENDLSGIFNPYLVYSAGNMVKMSVVVVVIGLLVYSVPLSLFEATKVAGPQHISDDSKMISALKNISNSIPPNQVIVTPYSAPIVMLFTGREIFTPQKEIPYTAFVNQMNKKNYHYLLVFENQWDIPGINKIFTKNELPKLSKDFREIATYVTDFSKLHLYKRITQDLYASQF